MSKTYPSQTLKQVLLRIPEEMRDALETAAKENGRSLTAEVLARLETTFPTNEPWLSQMQHSPTIRLEKQMMKDRADLEQRIDDLGKEVTAIKRQLERGTPGN